MNSDSIYIAICIASGIRFDGHRFDLIPRG